MKISGGILALVAAIFLIVTTGCEKETPYYPGKATFEDFTGSWDGELSTFQNSQIITYDAEITFFLTPGSDQMNGILVMDKIYALTQIQIREGIYYFQMLNSDTANPFCANWNMSGFAQLGSADMMHIIISGKACGETGEEWLDLEGDFTLDSSSPDSTKYFSFGGVNRHWTYSVLTFGGDSCQMDYDITESNGYLFSGSITNNCSMPWGSLPLNWDVQPMHFSVLGGQDGEDVQYTFHIDQTINVPYVYYAGNDTNIVTLLGMDSVYVSAGGFYCSRYRLERRMHPDSSNLIDKGIISISNQFGIIRYQATVLDDTNDVIVQELTGINF